MVHQSFSPRRMKSPLSVRSTIVDRLAGSEPTSRSVRANAEIAPRAQRGRYFCFCASVPNSLSGWGAPIEFSVRPSLVVELAEAVELGLQLASRRGGWLLGEPAFEGLVPALDLALGLRVAGVAVLLGDAEDGE